VFIANVKERDPRETKYKVVYVSENLRKSSDISFGDQIRVSMVSGGSKVDKTTCLFTVKDAPPTLEEKGSSIWLTEEDKTMLEKLGDDEEMKQAFIEGYAPNPDINTVEEAGEQSEMMEESFNHDSSIDFFLSAPHGGKIESGTDYQVEGVIENIDVPSWIVRGYGSAFKRWHISSNLLQPSSFPEFDSLVNRKYKNSMSLHGYVYDGVKIGGRANMKLKKEFREILSDELPDDIKVEVQKEGEYLSGTSRDNYVNWTCENGGLHVEQSRKVRDEYTQEVSTAVTRFIEENFV
jgi:phage replication-related protein YjqB (UPF0714/DUF867 family)